MNSFAGGVVRGLRAGAGSQDAEEAGQQPNELS